MSDTLIDSYVGNPSFNFALNGDGSNGSPNGAGQCFYTGTKSWYITSVKFNLAINGPATGNAYAKLYAMTGTFGVNGKPTGSALATSTPLNVATLNGVPTETELIFPTPYKVSSGTYYVVTSEYNGGNGGSTYLAVAWDNTAPVTASYAIDSVWTGGRKSFRFYVYGIEAGGINNFFLMFD